MAKSRDQVRDEALRAAKKLRTKQGRYGPACPHCGYDGKAYHGGRYGWVDSKGLDGPMCASCGKPAEET